MKLYALTLCLIGTCSSAIAQIQIQQSAQIKEVMEIKKEFASQEKVFQIQVYNGGNLKDAEATVKAVQKAYHFPTELKFESPNYKVRMGRFRTRMEAEKIYTKLKEEYPASFIIAPSTAL